MLKYITFLVSNASRAHGRVKVLGVVRSDYLPEFYLGGATIPLVNFDVGLAVGSTMN
jgi:hypothetical protein